MSGTQRLATFHGSRDFQTGSYDNAQGRVSVMERKRTFTKTKPIPFKIHRISCVLSYFCIKPMLRSIEDNEATDEVIRGFFN